MTENPGQPPSMCVFKVKIDATKLSFEPTMEELANYLAVRLTQEFKGADYAPRPGFGSIADSYGRPIAAWLLQDGKQPYLEWPT